MKNRKFLYTGLIILGGLFLGFFDLPADLQKQIAPFTPAAITDSRINLGLDLQGGSQLDYKIDLRKVAELDQPMVIDGILGVINRRVNSLGVAEPNIYISDIGDEKHIIVELAGIKDLDEAKNVVGKTIQLEFKEIAPNGGADTDLVEESKQNAQSLLDKVLAGGDLSVLGKEEQQANPSRVGYIEETEFKSRDEISGNFAPNLFALEPGQTLERLVDSSGNVTINESGEFIPGEKGFYIIQTTDKQEEEVTEDIPRAVQVRQILIAHKDAERAEGITRNEEEALTLAKEIIQKLQDGESYEDLAKEFSDDAATAEEGGLLTVPVELGKGRYVKELEDEALAFKNIGDLSSDPVDSPFGFHILKAEDIAEAKSETSTKLKVKYISVYYTAAPDPWIETELDGQHFVRADVEFSPTLQPYVSIIFDDEGAKLFEELTRKNIRKPIAIFVGGNLVSAPNVNEVISGGRAQISNPLMYLL